MSNPAQFLVLAVALASLGCGSETGDSGEGEDSGPYDAGDAGDTDTGEDCGPQEITDESTGLVWKRCHAGGWWEWNGAKCACVGGLINTKSWEAIAEACEVGWRPASVVELMGVLEACDDWAAIEASGSGSCENCPDSEPCASLFANDGRMYWSATEAGEDEAYAVWFNVGTITMTSKSVDYYVRCVEE